MNGNGEAWLWSCLPLLGLFMIVLLRLDLSAMTRE
jgi:hypothetical protein